MPAHEHVRHCRIDNLKLDTATGAQINRQIYHTILKKSFMYMLAKDTHTHTHLHTHNNTHLHVRADTVSHDRLSLKVLVANNSIGAGCGKSGNFIGCMPQSL
jgi:hypothetical protein